MIITTGSKIQDENHDFYILDELLGKGGFAYVYKAHREKDGFVVAVKTLPSYFQDNDTALSFQKEIQQAKFIDSDHVIKYLYVHDGTQFPEYPPYIIMEFADGGTLADIIEKQKATGEQFDSDFIYDVIQQLSEGMKSISEHFVHRDIKPENILMKDGILKISDFGLSKFSDASTKTLTLKGSGTARYFPPEGWAGDKNKVQMDIYSMGIVFYEVATLNYPYIIGATADVSEYRKAHLYSAPQNPTKFNNSLSQTLTSIIIKMLEKPVQKRFDCWDSIISFLSRDEIPTDVVGSAVSRALAKRTEKDIQNQKKRADEEKIKQDKEDFRDLIYSQYARTVFDPINHFVEDFNSHYPGTGFKTNDKGFVLLDRFTYEITTPSMERITIETEVVFSENYYRQVPRDRVFGGSGYRTVNYTPQCQKRDVLAWSRVSDSTGKGFNILLLKAEGSLYGDWFVLTNTNSVFNRNPRPEPFGFPLSELPKEIVNINVTHIYDLKLSELNEAKLIDFFAEHV